MGASAFLTLKAGTKRCQWPQKGSQQVRAAVFLVRPCTDELATGSECVCNGCTSQRHRHAAGGNCDLTRSSVITTAQTPRDATQRLGSPLFISKIIFLSQRNCTLVSAAADGNLRFWQGQWTPTGVLTPHLDLSICVLSMPCKCRCRHAIVMPCGCQLIESIPLALAVPAQCATSVAPTSLACLVPGETVSSIAGQRFRMPSNRCLIDWNSSVMHLPCLI